MLQVTSIMQGTVSLGAGVDILKTVKMPLGQALCHLRVALHALDVLSPGAGQRHEAVPHVHRHLAYYVQPIPAPPSSASAHRSIHLPGLSCDSCCSSLPIGCT